MDAEVLIQKLMKTALYFTNSKYVSHFSAYCFENKIGGKVNDYLSSTFLKEIKVLTFPMYSFKV